MLNKSKVPQANPHAGYIAYKEEIDGAIARVLASGIYILGQEVALFEKAFAKFIGVFYGTGVASGTDAIEIALRAAGVGKGDLVFTVSHTAVATVAAIERCSALPVLIDVDDSTYTIDTDDLEETIQGVFDGTIPVQGQPRAIVPVHLYGYPAKMDTIMDISRKYNLVVIEDCAQAHGAGIDGRNVGTFGHMATFSFYPTKNLGAIGDGGMVVTNSENLYNTLRCLRQYGWERRYISTTDGINSRLDELQAAILRVKLNYLERDNQIRREIAKRYDEILNETEIGYPEVAGHVEHIYHQYVIRTKERDSFIKHMEDYHIGTAIHYPIPVHLQPAYKNRLPLGTARLEKTEKLCNEIVSLPMYSQMTIDEVDRVRNSLESWHKR